MSDETPEQPQSTEQPQPGGQHQPPTQDTQQPGTPDAKPHEAPPDSQPIGDQPRTGQPPQDRRGRDRFRPRHPYRQRQQNQNRQQPIANGPDIEAKSTEAPKQQGQPQQRPQPTQEQQGGTPQQHRIDISVVVPLYNEDESLKELHQQLRTALSRVTHRYELLFVDDGSSDRSFEVLRNLKRFDHRIKIIRFRRNYGKSAALSVGFHQAQGNIVITMDADLQDDPAEIPSFVKRINEGFDLVSGWKKVRRDPITKTIPSRFFNFITSVMTGIKIHDFNCGFKAYKKDVVKTVRVYGELHRYIPALAHWDGFKIGEMVVNHRPRKYGTTKFGMGRFWKGFLDLLTVLFTTRYFRRPLHLFGFWGIVAAILGLGVDGWLAVEWLTGQTSLSNRPLFLGGILLIIVGIQFISIGLLGELISKSKQSDEEYSIRDIIR